jgi:Ala-tRNA(Pro) deacylase
MPSGPVIVMRIQAKRLREAILTLFLLNAIHGIMRDRTSRQDGGSRVSEENETSTSTYARLQNMLEDQGIKYRVIDHPAEGRTSLASAMRGHPLSQAAKCMVVEVRVERYALCVIPGDAKVDFDAVCKLYGGTRARLASQETAERLTDCERGTIVPFSFRPDELEVVADPSLFGQEQLYFNAARLDRSFGICPDDLLQAANPRLANIAEHEQS